MVLYRPPESLVQDIIRGQSSTSDAKTAAADMGSGEGSSGSASETDMEMAE